MPSEPVNVYLTQGFVAVVSPEDQHAVGFHKWHASVRILYEFGEPEAQRVAYARTRIDGKIIYLHQFIAIRMRGVTRPGAADRSMLGASAHVDHLDGNRLNNTRENLRIVTPQENMQNRYFPNRTGFRGVSVERRHAAPMFCARITDPETRKRVFLGMWPTAEEAALAYNEAAVRFGFPTGRLNKVDGWEDPGNG